MRNSPQQQVPDDDDVGGTMGFLDHLEELRSRLIWSCVAVIAGMGVAALFIDRIQDFVLGPAVLNLPAGTSLITTRPGEAFSFELDLLLMAGAIVAAPFVTYQVWRFVAPGLHAREKRLVLPFIVFALCGTLGGAAFSHYLLFPSMMAFFASFDSPKIHLMARLEDTFELYRNMLLGMVVVFQLPTLAFVLARVGLITARFLWRHVLYAVFACFVAAAVLTPSGDPWNQTLFAIPMMALYLVSIVVAWLVAPRTRDTAAAMKIVVAATVIDQAWRFRRPAEAGHHGWVRRSG